MHDVVHSRDECTLGSNLDVRGYFAEAPWLGASCSMVRTWFVAMVVPTDHPG